MEIVKTSSQMMDLAAEVAGMLSIDGERNRWHGFDFTEDDGTVLRLAAEDPESGIEVYLLTDRGVEVQHASFGIDNRTSAIAAYVRAAV